MNSDLCLGATRTWSVVSSLAVNRVRVGSLAGLVDMLGEVVGGGQLGDGGLGLLVGHLGSCWCEVLIPLKTHTHTVHALGSTQLGMYHGLVFSLTDKCACTPSS